MTSCRIILALLAAFLTLAAAPARATDSHEYAKDEYAVIRDGLAPNKRMSLASHGDGEGNENFHVWLMAEPAHRRIVRLPGIGPDGILDTGPNAYRTTWALDSRHVAVNYRSDRHVLELNLYSVEHGRALPISGPSLFKDVTSRNVGEDEHFGHRVSTIEWTGTRRFRLREHHLFQTSNMNFTRLLGAYGKLAQKLDDGRSMVEFSAEADCVLISGHRYRIVDLRVGKFDK
ncbi:hypothetical protein SAMN05444050_3132 [Afipia sp. GAS231]|nr:hypothetical protein SAMN05444050_3132 [Afipia sp. GAS231]